MRSSGLATHRRGTDASSPANAGGLQNQLYLRVVPPGGTPIDGGVTAYPNASNNVQQVIIDTPVETENYEIQVHGVSVTDQAPGASGGTNPRQDFALVVANGMGMSLQPVSIAQAIDTTGSMGYYGYMEPAKEGAQQLVDFMRINDKAGSSRGSSTTENTRTLGGSALADALRSPGRLACHVMTWLHVTPQAR